MGGSPRAEQARAGRPRDARLDARITAATVELLAERGYHDTTLAAVAERAGTTTAAIYRRWGSKSELVARAVFRTDGDDVVADTGDVAADLATMVRWSVQKLAHPAAVAAIAGLLGEPRADRRARVAEATIAVDRTTERLRRAQAEGELRGDVAPEVLAALIDGPVLHAALSGTADRLDDRWVDDLVAVVLDGARPRPGSRAGRSATARPARHRAPSPRPRPRSDTTEVTRP